MNYSGDIEVEDNEFTLHADQFIIRENEISFELSGAEEVKFKIEGIAKKTEHGFYMAPRLPIAYEQHKGEYIASVRIDSLSFSEKMHRCTVEGVWIENNQSWSFSGNLRKTGA